jgi:predicted transcriptional regulator
MPLHTNEVRRRTGLGKGTVVRALKILESKGILESEKKKNRVYYKISHKAPTWAMLQVIGYLKKEDGEGEEKERGEGVKAEAEAEAEPFKTLRDLAQTIEDCEAYMNAAMEYLKVFSKSFKNLEDATERITSAIAIFDAFNAKVLAFQRFFDAKRSIIEFMRDEFLIEGIDILDLPLDTFIPILIRFEEVLAPYKELRQRGVKPEEAFKWAKEWERIKRDEKWKQTPFLERALAKKGGPRTLGFLIGYRKGNMF